MSNPKPPTWKQLTPKQRKALNDAAGNGINPKTTVHAQTTIDQLIALQLVHASESRKRKLLYRTTDTGRGLVAARGMVPTFLKRSYSQSNYTSRSGLAMRGEPEAFKDAA